MRTFLAPAALLALLASSGCESPPPPAPEPEISEPLPPPPPAAIPADWRELPPRAFEDAALATFDGEPKLLAEADLEALEAALGDPDVAIAVRAAVLLGRSGDPAAVEALLRRLEARVDGPSRNSDAGDVVAATALTFHLTPDRAPRLANLASGDDPHPDLEVRVECARAALRLGDTSVVPFLLSVLRIGTPSGRATGPFWPPPLRSAWCRERAAEVLAWHAHVDNSFSADASLADRERFADELTRLLGY